MIILEQPYVSKFLLDTIKKNAFSVLKNKISQSYFNETTLTNEDAAIQAYREKHELFYTNSENAINWFTKHLPHDKITYMIDVCKNKAVFREKLASLYPNYFFSEYSYVKLKQIKTQNLKFPCILKPCIGFLSLGVYPIKNEKEWDTTLQKLTNEIERIQDLFPAEVVNVNNFIIEQFIEGDEFAIDGYYDINGNATILNIFQHPFFNDDDVSDRAYFTSKSIFTENYEDFQSTLNAIGKALDFQEFPFHLELRRKGTNIIPIEMNPLRFCGWCITDIAQNTWGINVYEHFFNQTSPNWKQILDQADDDFYYFTMADIPSDIQPRQIKEIEYSKYLSNFKNPLEVRKIDYTSKPCFAIVFAKTPSLDEIKHILKVDMHQYITL